MQIGIMHIMRGCIQIAALQMAKVLIHIAVIIHYQIHIWYRNIPICCIINHRLENTFRLSNYIYIIPYPFIMHLFSFDYYDNIILRKLPVTKISIQNILRKLPLLRKLPVIFVICYENYRLFSYDVTKITFDENVYNMFLYVLFWLLLYNGHSLIVRTLLAR